MPDRHGSIYMYRVVLYEKYVLRQRPYYDEYTRSHQNSEVKHRKARSVLGWGTAWEALRVPLAFLELFEKFTLPPLPRQSPPRLRRRSRRPGAWP